MTLSLKTYARIYELKQKGAKGRTFAEDQELKKLNLKLKIGLVKYQKIF